VFIVKVDIQSEANINMMKRFADVIIENREHEKMGKIIKEARVSNQVDTIYSYWERY